MARGARAASASPRFRERWSTDSASPRGAAQIVPMNVPPAERSARTATTRASGLQSIFRPSSRSSRPREIHSSSTSATRSASRSTPSTSARSATSPSRRRSRPSSASSSGRTRKASKRIKDVIESRGLPRRDAAHHRRWAPSSSTAPSASSSASSIARPASFFDDDDPPERQAALFSARIIPYRGTWVEFTIDMNDIMYVYIDRRRKIPVTILLARWASRPTATSSSSLQRTEVIELGSRASAKDAGAVGRFVAEDVVEPRDRRDPPRGGPLVTETALERMKSQKVAKIAVVEKDGNLEEDVILKTLEKDPTHDPGRVAQEPLQPDAARGSAERGDGARRCSTGSSSTRSATTSRRSAATR